MELGKYTKYYFLNGCFEVFLTDYFYYPKIIFWP